MSAALQKAGCDAKLLLVPGGHRSGFDIIKEDEPLKWLLANKRNPKPASHHLKTYSLQFVGPDYSIKKTDALEPIDVEWKGEGKGAIEVIKKSSNVLEFGGKTNPAAPGLKKLPALCGPVRQAICSPFTIVYGTTGKVIANDANKKNAERFAEEWFAFTRSRAQIKADSP